MLKKTHCIIILAMATFFVILTSSCTKMPDANPEDGERWFRMNRCNGCHGEKGIGGKGIGEQGPVIAGLQLSYRKFLKQVRNPNSAIMPAFSETQLSDKEAADMYIWLKNQ